jgi:putative ATP-dependent endonuclease of the OLD family
MKICSIEAKNFRTLEDIKIEFSTNYCTISGANNSGKSSVVYLIQNLLRPNGRGFWRMPTEFIDFSEDRTKWKELVQSVEVTYEILLDPQDDSALLAFISKMSPQVKADVECKCTVKHVVDSKTERRVTFRFGDVEVDEVTNKETLKRLSSSNLLFLYNSTQRGEGFYHDGRRGQSFFDLALSSEENQRIQPARRSLEQKMTALAKTRTQDLSGMIGKLAEKYEIELAPLDGSYSDEMPMRIVLKDKSVTAPLSDWGSGTQNRTHIIMAILQAHRIKSQSPASERTTPIVVVEEPESFLHPSAQAEFGRVLCEFADELGIQLIITTHSPYMLNQKNPNSNILLARKLEKAKPRETFVVDTVGDKWMAPFADQLGIKPELLGPLRSLFASDGDKVLLVEGAIDKSYFEICQKRGVGDCRLDEGVTIQEYGGKDILKNTILLKFTLNRFAKYLVSYDRDAHDQVKGPLTSLGLEEGKHFVPIGGIKPGADCIEGLMPDSIKGQVYAEHVDLIQALGSTDSKAKKSAKSELKQKLLAKFNSKTEITVGEFPELAKLIRAINKTLK